MKTVLQPKLASRAAAMALPRVLCLVATSLLTTPAWGDGCPNAETAKLGFVLERQETQTEVRPAPGGFVHAVNRFPSGKKQDAIYYGGFFLISRFDDTARTINVPVSDLRSILPLDMKARRAITYAPSEPGKVGSLVSLELSATGLEEMELGPCTYEVLAVRYRFFNGEGRVIEEHTELFSPELGFSLGRRYDERNGAKTTVRYQTIRPLDRKPPF